MADAQDTPQAGSNDATFATSCNEPPDVPAAECGQAAQGSPVGSTTTGCSSPEVTIAAMSSREETACTLLTACCALKGTSAVVKTPESCTKLTR